MRRPNGFKMKQIENQIYIISLSMLAIALLDIIKEEKIYMLIINMLADIQRLKESKFISQALAEHLKRKLKAPNSALEPGASPEDFSLGAHGQIGIMEKGDRVMTAVGLPASLNQIMPEWISRLDVDKTTFYILYTMASNDEVVQIYLPDPILEETVRAWLAEQPLEKDGADV